MNVLCHVLWKKILNSTQIKNDRTYENLSTPKSESHVPPIDNKWDSYAIKYGEYFLTHHHNRSEKYTLKRHIQKFQNKSE